jgi:hypothetical protein
MIPDKEAALVILHLLLELEAYEPAPLEDDGGGPMERPEGKPLPVELENKLRRTLLRNGERGRRA